MPATGDYKKSPTYAWDTLKDWLDDNTQEMGKAVGGISSLVSGVQQLGIKVPAGINKMLSVLQGITTILTAIQTISTVKLWSHGGVVHAALGYTVPGNYGYDAVPSLLTSGEVVLNRAQQGNLLSQLQQRGSGEGTPQARVSGEQIYIALTNYMNRRGYGETLISR